MSKSIATDDLFYASLLDVSGMVRRREVSPVELVKAMLERIARLNPMLNAYLLVTADAALDAANTAEAELSRGLWRGPLHGVPIGLKDLFEIKGVPATFATTAYRVLSDKDATIIHRLKTAGAISLGQLHLHEGAFGEHHPALRNCINPWNAAYWPGGSSSGSGSATATGLCFASLGTDTGGSIRFPSAACGVTGLKVTWGRTSRYGVFALANSLDTIGPMARSAADCAAMLEAFAGADPHDPTSLDAAVPAYLQHLDGVLGARGLRIGIDEAYLTAEIDDEVSAAILTVVGAFSEMGATIVPVTVPDRQAACKAALAITDAECAWYHRDVFKAQAEAFGPALRGAIERGLAMDAVALADAYIEKERFRGTIKRFFADVDMLISPIYPKVGLRYDEMEEALRDLYGLIGYTSPYNLSGVPSITFPCGFSSVGMPIGVQLIGPHLSEPMLLKAAHAYQQITDWHRQKPPIA
ncbi:amidase [Rhizobium sp. CC-YZS058]|uniref:amidase n=1 Tax=Rhizobium sp. CC-YZS058 TaxID=3042153 RepID=UPI002B058C31|nr:amidase [Rhizobium sp. CC-YZS058]MEA3536650.1 amidase [Rhizobium sp. CC-YZS058]